MSGEDELTARLTAADRDRSPGAAPIVALAADEDPAFVAAVHARALRIAELERRGTWHGEWAELQPDADPVAAPDDPRPVWRQRFERAAPIVLPGLVDPTAFAEELEERMRLFDDLQEPGGLRRFLDAHRAALEPEYTLRSVGASTADPRDLERAELACVRPGRAQRWNDLWLKSSWLSTHEDDASLRMRFSFGREIEDDASRDLPRHLAVSELAARLLPEVELATESMPLQLLLQEWIGAPTFFAQHIAYWNAPGGGALFHHDAFDEPVVGGQRGVVYMQLTGTSAWLALSLTALADHVRDFVEALAAGDAPWIRASLWSDEASFAGILALVRDRRLLADELARPGCGRLASLVNRGPEFTGWLADAGHAALLDPGDVIVLPNHGLGATCMHSVFCASDEPGYALSLAIRERHPAEPGEDPPRRAPGGAAAAAPGTRVRGGTHPGPRSGNRRRRRR